VIDMANVSVTSDDFNAAVKETLDQLSGTTVRAKLFAALAKAQSQMAGAAKDSVNPHFKSHYADLASCWDACRKPLTDNQLTILQPVKADGVNVTVTTILAHSSGEWISESLTMTAGANTPQAIGSTITYGRRYGLCAMVGIAPEDDDGEAGSQQTRDTSYTVKSPVSTADPNVTKPAGLSAEDLPAGVVYITKVSPGMGKAKAFISHSGQAADDQGIAVYDDRLADLARECCQAGTAVALTPKISASGKVYLVGITTTPGNEKDPLPF